MICRMWRGRTTAEKAQEYQDLVLGQVIPEIEALELRGFRRIDLLRAPPGPEGHVVFTTLMWFDRLEDVRAFTGEDFEVSWVPPAARAVLETYEDRATHLERLERPAARPSRAPPSGLVLPPGAALVVIDVQEGFRLPGWGERNNPEAEQNVAALLRAWRRTRRPVHHVHHASLGPDGRFRPGTAGHRAVEEAWPCAGEPVHVKSVNSAFIGTQLEEQLRRSGIRTLVLVGLTTDHCVSTSVRMAANLGFQTFLVSDATASFARTNLSGRRRSAAEVHDDALSDLSGEFAAIVSTEEVLGLLGAPEGDVASAAASPPRRPPSPEEISPPLLR